MSDGERTKTEREQKLFTILRNDFRQADFKRTFHQEFAELKEVMLTEERRERLLKMSPLKRSLAFAWWLLKSMIRKLTPVRRLLLVLSLVLLWVHVENGNESYDFTPLGIMLLLFILLLELKDKLVAHEELNAGRVVQQALIPQRTPEIPGWQLWLFTRSANEVGGDIIDFLRIDERRYGIVLGDVAGKGLSAALLSAKLQATIRALAPDFASLDALGVKLNSIYCRDGLRSFFASMNYIELQPGTGVIRILNAGHMPPIITRGSKIEILKKGGPALGIILEATHTEQRVDLEKGETIILYSDGITEAQNEHGGFYGEERLLSLMSRIGSQAPVEIGSRIVAEVDLFLGMARATDDLSLAVIQRTDQSRLPPA